MAFFQSKQTRQKSLSSSDDDVCLERFFGGLGVDVAGVALRLVVFFWDAFAAFSAAFAAFSLAFSAAFAALQKGAHNRK